MGGCWYWSIGTTEGHDFVDYLKGNAKAGDAVHVFDITASLEDGKQLTYGKCPDEHDEVPRKGAY